MEHLIKALKEIQVQEFEVATSRGVLALQQTQRNATKAKVLEAFYKDLQETLEEEGFNVYLTAYGPVIEVLNDKVMEDVYTKEHQAWLKDGNRGNKAKWLKAIGDNRPSGQITIQMDSIMKNLDTNAELDAADFEHEKEQKRIREEEKAKKKRAKIERDAEARAEKNRLREEKLAKIERNRKD